MWTASVIHQSTSWMELEGRAVRGLGQLVPRLAFEITARLPVENVEAMVPTALVTLSVQDEVCGTATAVGLSATRHGTNWTIEVPVAPGTIERAEAAAGEGDIRLQLSLSGTLRVRDSRTEQPRIMSGIPQDKAWHTVAFDGAQAAVLQFEVARSRWFKEVRGPLGTLRYLSVEIGLPRDHAWAGVVESLKAAERSYSTGGYSEVFHHCRLAIESIPPGKPDKILAPLEQTRRVQRLNELARATSAYLHTGRHTEEGVIEVSRDEAQFALNQTRVMIAHLAHLLVGQPPVA